MTRKHYAVHTVRDEPVRLRDQLDHIAADGGTVVSVIWQPARPDGPRDDGHYRVDRCVTAHVGRRVSLERRSSPSASRTMSGAVQTICHMVRTAD
jgi:hypothetical protein